MSESMDAQVEKEVAPKGQGELEGFLILSKYIKVYGLSGAFIDDWKSRLLKKRGNILGHVVLISMVSLCALLSYLFYSIFGHKIDDSEFFGVFFLIFLLSAFVSIIVTLIAYQSNNWANNYKGLEMEKNYQSQKFLKEFGINLHEDVRTQKEKIYFFLNWSDDFFKKFELLNNRIVTSYFEEFKYLDDNEKGYQMRVMKIIFSVVDLIRREIRNDLTKGGDSLFLPFWKNAKDLQQESLKNRSQLELMEQIKSL